MVAFKNIEYLGIPFRVMLLVFTRTAGAQQTRNPILSITLPWDKPGAVSLGVVTVPSMARKSDIIDVNNKPDSASPTLEPGNVMARNSDITVVEVIDQSKVKTLQGNVVNTTTGNNADNNIFELLKMEPIQSTKANDKINVNGNIQNNHSKSSEWQKVGRKIHNDHAKSSEWQNVDQVVVASNLENFDNLLHQGQNVQILTSQLPSSSDNLPDGSRNSVLIPMKTVPRTPIPDHPPRIVSKLQEILRMSIPRSPFTLSPNENTFHNLINRNFSQSHANAHSSNFNMTWDENGLKTHLSNKEISQKKSENHSWTQDGDTTLHSSEKSENSNKKISTQTLHKLSDIIKLSSGNISTELDTAETEKNILSDSLITSVRQNLTKQETNSRNISVNNKNANPTVHQANLMSNSEKIDVNIAQVTIKPMHETFSSFSTDNFRENSKIDLKHGLRNSQPPIFTDRNFRNDIFKNIVHSNVASKSDNSKGLNLKTGIEFKWAFGSTPVLNIDNKK